ncbi:MAG: RHS repeat protein, partial [Verrucomicrobia bacterium]|nr:RHS repeat protein [Verrucomicrobiota bacterium]
LTEIKTVSHDHKHTHNWIRFRQKSDADFEKKPCLHIETSDKQNFTFRYKKLKKHTHGVSRIERPGLAALNFGYSENSSSHKKVVKSSTDDGHFIRTAYYKNGRHKGRVKQQSAPVGEQGKEVVTHRYSYHFRKKGEKTHYATVVDAYGTITRYHWNRFKRLVKITKYSPNWKHLMSEEFVWGDKKHTGHLKVRTLFDENDTPLLSRRFVYDARGNVKKEVLYGRFTENSGSIKLDDNGYPNKSTCDTIVTRRIYSKEGYNLKVEEIDCIGNHTYYSYFPHSNRLKSKLVCDGKKIKKREFFSYNKSACVIQHITDDGSTKERDNLAGATQRHITKIRPRLKYPHFGEPRVVEEYYWDFDLKKERLLTKTLNVYSKNGNISQKRVSGADENHHSTSRYDHDHVGRITYSKDAVGREQFFKYDHFGRLIEKRGPRSDVTTYYDYDRCGHLVKEAEVVHGGFTYVTQYRYDLLGRKVAVIDPQGHETHISYDRLNRITKIAYPNIYDHNGEAVSPVRTFEYEKLGTKVVQRDENAYTTTTIFNAAGKIISQERPDKTIIKNFYDIKGNCIKEIAPNGVEQHIAYDAFDRPTAIVMKEGDKELSRKSMEYTTFHLTSETSPTGEKCLYSYDYAGRKKAVHLQGSARQNHRVTTYGYDSMGRPEREESHGVVKTFVYDEADRLTSESVKNSSGETCSYTIYGYDVDDNCSEVIRSIMDEPASTTTLYDAHGRVIKETDAKGNVWNYAYNDFYTSINKKNVTEKTTYHPTGVTEREVFDVHGNSSYLSRYDPFGTLIAEKKCYYDASDNCIRVKESSIVEGKQEKAITTLLSYGPGNRLECIIEAYNTHEQKTTRYAYNRFGQKEKTIHTDGSATETHYDSKGRVKRFFGRAVDYTYSYDASDRITSVFNALNNHTTIRSYDDIGNLHAETLESSLKMEYAYDELGRVKELVLPDHSKVGYSYSPVFLESIERTDTNNVKQWQYTVFARDLSGNVLSADLPGQTGTAYFSYDSLNRRTKVSHYAFSEELLQFDPAGNLLQLSF